VFYEKNTAVYIHTGDLTKAKVLHAPDSVSVRVEAEPSTPAWTSVEVTFTAHGQEQKDVRNVTENTLLSTTVGISTAIEYSRLVTESNAAEYFWLLYTEWYVYTCTLEWKLLQKIHLDRTPGLHSGNNELEIRWYGNGDALVTREYRNSQYTEDVFTLFYVTPETQEAKTVTRGPTPIYRKQNETPERTIWRWSNNTLTFISKKNHKKQFCCRENESGGIYGHEDNRVYVFERPNEENDDITDLPLLHADTSGIG